MPHKRRRHKRSGPVAAHGAADLARLMEATSYQTLLAAFPVIFFTTDVNGVILLSEGRGLDALGLRPGQLIGFSVFDVYRHLPDGLAALRAALDGNPATSIDRVAGRTLETRLTPLRDGDGAIAGVAGMSLDVTARIEAEQRLLHVNRLYAVLSQVGEMVVRINDQQQLFETVCRIASEQGGFRLAWIGLVDNETRLVHPVAASGAATAYLQHIYVSARNEPAGSGPTGRAIREGRPVICNDIDADLQTLPWRVHAAQHTLRSSAAFPLLVHGHVIGALNLYAGVTGFFDAQEIALSERVASVLSFALEKLEEEQRRRQVEQIRQLDVERQDALLRLSEMNTANEREIVDFALEEAVRLTRSRIGYLHFINEDQVSLQLFTWSRGVREECYAEETTHYPLEQAGVWVDCVRQRQPVFHNDYQNLPNRRGYPDGHIHLIRHLSVPLIDGDRVVAVTGVGNKTDPYDDTDARQLLLFMNGMWSMLQRKRAEAALRESDMRYRRITEHALDIIYRYRFYPTAGFEYVSPSVTGITGYSPDDHYADPELGFKLVHPADREKLEQLGRDDTPYASPLELRWVRRDGSVLWVEQRNVPVYDTDGRLIAIEGIARDITERKLAEEALRTERALLETRVGERTRELQQERDRTRAILEALGEAVIVVDLNDQVQYVNPAATALTGIGPESLPVSWNEWLQRQTDAYEALARMRAAVHAGRTWNDSLVLVRADGIAYDADMNAAPLFSPDHPGRPIGFVSVHRDITTMKVAERMKDQFVSNVSHELRSPTSLITMLAGSLEMLYPRLDDARRLEVIGDIRKHARDLSDLIGGVLEISRIDGGRIATDRQALDLALLAREEVEALAPAAQRKRLAFTIHAPQEVQVFGQTGQLRQVIRNLLTNAIKYTPEQGSIRCIATMLTLGAAEPVPPGDVWPGSARLPEGRWAALCVRDTGIGIEPADLPHIFERFYRAQTQTDIPGTGLGLSIAWELVRLHGGYLDAHSTPGAGSAFAFYLPIAREASQ